VIFLRQRYRCVLSSCRKKRLSQATFVLLYFVLFFSVLSLVFVVSVLDLSSVTYFPACTNVNGSVYPNCADVLLRITHSITSVRSCCRSRYGFKTVERSGRKWNTALGSVIQRRSCAEMTP